MAARPSLAGEAWNADAIPFLALAVCNTIQQIVEFGAEVFESARLHLHQRLEFFVRKQHGLWRAVSSNYLPRRCAWPFPGSSRTRF